MSARPIKRLLKHALIEFFKLVETRPRRFEGAIATLYHEVSDKADDYSVSNRVLTSQIEYLLARDAHWCTATELAENLSGFDSSNRVCITFDDGDPTAFEPTLALVEAGAKCTHFMIPGRIEQKQKRALPWSRVRELDAAGVEIGSHSYTHPWLTRMSDGELKNELQASKMLLEDKLGKAVTSFAYPYGAFDARVVRAVRGSGYRCAYTTRHFYISNDTNPFTIPRFEPVKSVEQMSDIYDGHAASFYRLLAFFAGGSGISET